MLFKKRKITFLQNKFCRLFLAAVIAVFLAVVVEVMFNYRARPGRTLEMDLSSYIERSEGSVECNYKFDHTVYLSKLLVRGSFDSDIDYTVELVTDNGFGVKEQELLEDKAYAVYSDAFTSINKAVREITFRIDSDKGFEVDQIVVSNVFSFNKYRFLLVAVIFFLAGLIVFFRRLLTDKLEWLFVCFALGFGMLIVVMSGPSSQTWDEQIHFRNMYNLSSGETVDWNAAAWYNYKNELPEFNTKEELFMLRKYQDGNADTPFHLNENPAGFEQFAMRAYFPMVLFFSIGRLLGLPYSMVYMLGRIGNLIFYILIMWLAIRLAKDKKILIFSLAVLPTVLFQESMYTYDGVVFSLMVLGFVLLLNEFSGTERVNAFRLTAAIALIVVGCFSKAVYIPMLLFALALPNSKFLDKKQAYLFRACVCAVFLLMMGTFVLPVLTSSAETNLAYSDARGGDTGVLAQILSMLKHPVATVKLFVSSIFSFDNFRNLGYASADNYLITNLMFLNFASLGTLPDKWSLLLVPLLLLLFFIPVNRIQGYSVTQKVWMGLLLLGTAALVWLAMYLSFTTVGSDQIEGVQARYYLPLLVPLCCITRTNCFACRMKEGTYNGIVVGLNGILIAECIYQLMLQGRCL